MIFQQVGYEMFHGLVYIIYLFIHEGIVEIRYLQARTHEGYGTFVVELLLLSEQWNEWSVRSERVKKEIFVEIWVV